ncbi:hypothetical protein AB0E01_22910 [Nocardia vinacea]|uniref:hypothetical protein n=1 Tax=Nocardia vinacea TaxID=96468 RepID=UPI0033EC930E
MSAQHVMLDALITYASEHLDGDDHAYAVENEPQSTVFHSSDFEDWDEDDYESMKAVTTADLHRKLAYWTSVVDGIKA